MMTVKNPATNVTNAAPPRAEAAFDDFIARNRACPPVSPESVPSPSQGYRPTSGDLRNQKLRKLDGDLESEAKDVIRELIANSATLAQDLGKGAPNPVILQPILDRAETNHAAVVRIDALSTCAHELEDITLSDIVLILEASWNGYQHNVQFDAGLTTRYENLVKL